MRRLAGVALLAALAAVAAFTPAAATSGHTFPDVIPLPNGWQPEGIATGRGTSFYVGSLANGAVYRGDLRTGEGAVLVPGQPGSVAVGMKVDARSNLLFVAGGPTGRGTVYDAGTGALVASYQLTPTGTFVNDVIVTREAAYFTNSFLPLLHRVPLGPGGAVDPAATPQSLPLSGDWVQGPGFNANGIEATPNGKWLIVVNSTRGELYRVDPGTGEATLIDLGGALVTAGDGLLLHGKTLFVVRNRLNEVAVVELAPDLASGVVARTITSPFFRVPTTVAGHGSSLYLVNARFGTPPTPATEYEVVKVPRG